jgi:DNA (cytosine-5)-methyltransferase 1
MATAATIFSGGGGADIGLSQAGLGVRWGIEQDEAVAQVARENGLPVQVGDVTEVDPGSYEAVDVLHASPPCPNFSVAKTAGKETEEDVSLARGAVRFVRGVEPKLFTLENVWGYRKSDSWRLIREVLQGEGYRWNAWRLCVANYGVPQTRKRMIVAARKCGPRPTRPPATHAEEPGGGGLFGEGLSEWVGWYEAVQDLIPGLPETELADWQKDRLPDELVETTIVDTQPNARGQCRRGAEPTKTVAADPSGGVPRAVLVSNMNTEWGDGMHEGDEPSLTVTDQHGGRLRAMLGRRVVQMTPRCLARFQSFPDSYELPESKSLACRIIGNAVPPLAMRKWIQNWTKHP